MADPKISQSDLIASGKNGFTLIEVLIAIIVFAIGVLAVITMQSTSVGGNATARYISEATGFATDQMEQLVNTSYSHATLSDADGDGDAGMGDFQCCPGNIDPWGDAVAGCVDVADHCSNQGDNYGIYWNVMVNQPIINLKSIRMMVTGPTLRTPVSLNFIKADAL